MMLAESASRARSSKGEDRQGTMNKKAAIIGAVIAAAIVVAALAGIAFVTSSNNASNNDAIDNQTASAMNNMNASGGAIGRDNSTNGAAGSVNDNNAAVQDTTPQQQNAANGSNATSSVTAQNITTTTTTTTTSTSSVPDAASKNIDDIMIYGVTTDDTDLVDTARTSEFGTHPDTGYANMLSTGGNQTEMVNIARTSFKTMNWNTLTHTDSITKQDSGFTYLTRTYTGSLTDGRHGTLTVDIIYETDSGKLVYALLTGFTATQQLPSGTMQVEDMLASSI